MKFLFLICSLITYSLANASIEKHCNELKQAFMDSKRFHKKECKLHTDCELADLSFKPCSTKISLNKEFTKTGLKHFIELKEKAFGACQIKVPVCNKRENLAICIKQSCTSINEVFNKTPKFKIYTSFEGLTTPPNEIVLRRQHRVYCITTPCPPLVNDQKIKLVEGTLIVNNTLIPYPKFNDDIKYFLMLKGYKKLSVSKSTLIELKNQTIEFKLSEER